MNEHLLEIDGLNILRRCYEANPAPDSAEKAQSALRSSAASVRRALQQYRPTHVVLVMDPAGPNWRHALYPQYKAQRKPMPAPLFEALREGPGWQDWVRKLGIATWEVEGFEADDLLASLTESWHKQFPDAQATILSTDKDLCGLACNRVHVRDHFNEVLRDVDWVLAKFGVFPKQIPDYLALMGDATDGIPGVARIGAKSAASLLQEYETLEEVLQAAGDMPGARGKALREGAESARLSRQLTQLRSDLSFDRWDEAKAPA